MKIILLSGFSNSGKTTTIERLSKFLVGKHYKIGVLKHTHFPYFSIDKRGKDTWRFAKSGAKIIVSISNSELVMIKKGRTNETSVESLVDLFRKNRIDFLFIEGFYKAFARQRPEKIIRVLCARSKSEVASLVTENRKPVCVTGKLVETLHENEIDGVPLTNNIRRIASMILKAP